MQSGVTNYATLVYGGIQNGCSSYRWHTLGTRGFSRVRREFSVFGRRRAGHYKDLTETGNRARKVSGTQGTGGRALFT